MKCGTQLEHGIGKILGYRAIADLPRGQNGGHFPKWLLPDTILPTITNIMSTVGLANPIH